MNKVLRQLKEKVKAVSRKKKDNFFYSLCPKEATIVDVGVYPEIERGTKEISTNHFLKGFRFRPEFYTGLSIDSLDGMEKLYPGKRFVQYNGGAFPFKDKSFAWAYSNAVIEHVGDYQTKLTFVKEMVRVADQVFFTTPNKYFPVDAHTMVFFIHWNDSLFLKWREKNNKWMPKESLNLLSYSEIKQLLKDANVKDFKIIRNRFMGMTMTFSVIINCPGKKSTNDSASGSAKQKVEQLLPTE
jgi:hypothetical protein